MAFLDIGNIDRNTSYVRGNSFHDGFNTAIGVFGTNSLEIENNVIHRTVGASIQVTGDDHSLENNLVAYMISSNTYKGRRESFPLKWPGAIEVHKTTKLTLRGNAVGGSERFGFVIDGEECRENNNTSYWSENVVHGAWHGIHIGYHQTTSARCIKIANFITWKNYKFGVFAYPEKSLIIENVIAADNPIGMFVSIWGPSALLHKVEDKFLIIKGSLVVGATPGPNCQYDDTVPYAAIPYEKKKKGEYHLSQSYIYVIFYSMSLF